ncbi:restriction endonuclease [Allosaccharopolyspora coralli]|uniref:Restriction endonuclease n=1 Tax=Allosaccharopolyspora coralli TaxID=2665642 RepID=A0A5Q3QCZ4_9PSEU|nr:restriction endonuclease [Allosaccharopolyspora coralli]
MTRTRHRYVLAENDRSGVPAALGAQQAHALRESGLVDVRWEGDGSSLLVPRGRVGAVNVDGVDVIVTPKVGIARLLFLLGYARDPGFRPEDVEGIQEDDLWAAVAETVCRHAERALARGILQGYVTEDAALTVMRGRLRIADQISRRPGMLLPLEVRYDEYSVDIPENRLLRTAIRRVRALPRLREELVARLRHLDARLDGVVPLVTGAPLPEWQPTRLNTRYQSSLRLAEMVLRMMSFEVGSGGIDVAAFVVDMATVFENFVALALGEALSSRPGATIPQYPACLDRDGEIRMKVDVVHVVDRIPRIIADAKYKLADSAGRYPNADHYQMLAYCTALQLPKAWLVYASGDGSARPRRILNSPVSVIEYPLDLATSPGELVRQVAILADRAWDE